MDQSNVTATISKVDDNSTITSVYVHHDGDPSKLGQMLYDDYSNEEKIDELIALGSYSRVFGEVKNYHRDMQQIWNDVKPQINEGYDEAVKNFTCQEWNYFYVNGEWQVSNFLRVRKPLIAVF